MRIFFKCLSIIALCSISLWFLACFTLYRVPKEGDWHEFEGKVIYKFVELNIDNRQIFEEFLGNKVARIDGFPPFYVSKRDHARLWPENPHDMAKIGYTIKAKIKAKRLLFGGFSKAKVISSKRLNEPPRIRK